MKPTTHQNLVHIGERQLEAPKITVIAYDDANYSSREIKPAELSSLKTESGVVWVNLDGVQEPKTLEVLGQRFGLHPLVVEDIAAVSQATASAPHEAIRPKLEEYDDCIFVVLKMLCVDEKSGHIYVEQMSLVLGRNFVVTLQQREGDVFDDVRGRIKNATGKIRKAGADYLAYRLVDAIVDNYFVALDAMGDLIEAVETQMTDDPTRVDARELHTLKRESLFLRKVVIPARELIATFAKIEDVEFVKPTTLVYLRDVYDHVVQVAETLEVQRGILASMTDVYHASISNRMNEVMKVMTIVSTIFIPLSFIAGVYGMNFENMPELKTQYGYFVVLAVMALSAVGMLVWFKRKKWF